MPRNRALLVLALAVVVLATLLGVAATRGGTSNAPTTASAPVPVIPGAQALTLQFERVVQAVEPSVVQIETTQGLGSGVILDAQGHIVTNAHVIGSARTFTVTLYNGSRLPGTLVASFPPEDIGVVKIEAKQLRPIGWASSTKVGEIVMAIGNPLGLRASVTQGIVSAVGRLGQEGGGIVLPDTVQTSAPINPGNSGGALVNLRGQMVGIPTLGAVNPEVGTPARSASRSQVTARSSSRGSWSQTGASRTLAALSSASGSVRPSALLVS
jgi:putative serine protease PepD